MNTTINSHTYSIPETNFFVRDSTPQNESEKFEVLERYYNDIYKLFLAKLTALDSTPTISSEDSIKLKRLLEEIIYVKTLLQELK